MSRAAFAMLMVAAEDQFKSAFAAEDMDAIESALADMRRLHREYYGYQTLCSSALLGDQAA
jgi:hypothetical protein